jgi:hypothetical protein
MIIKHLNGSYEVIVHGQDTERCICKSAENAIKAYKNMYSFLNNCEPGEVEVPRIQDRTIPPEVVAQGDGSCEVTDDQIHQALDQAAFRCPFKPGYRYQVHVHFREMSEPTFQGEGI